MNPGEQIVPGILPQAKINITPEDAQPMLCPGQVPHSETGNKTETCGHNTYIQVFKLGRVSKLLTGQPEDIIMQVVELACQKCGHILKD
jgi:hypothetical protein